MQRNNRLVCILVCIYVDSFVYAKYGFAFFIYGSLCDRKEKTVKKRRVRRMHPDKPIRGTGRATLR